MTRARASSVPPILVIDDSPDDVYIVTRLLQKSGARNPIQALRDGEEAVELLSKAKAQADFCLPLAIFTDLAMPRRDGLALLKWINGIPELSTVFRVVISIFDDAENVRQANSHGCQAYYRKYPTAAQCRELCSAAESYARGGKVRLAAGPNLLHPRARA